MGPRKTPATRVKPKSITIPHALLRSAETANSMPIITANMTSEEMIGLCATNEKSVDEPTNAPKREGIIVSASIV